MKWNTFLSFHTVATTLFLCERLPLLALYARSIAIVCDKFLAVCSLKCTRIDTVLSKIFHKLDSWEKVVKKSWWLFTVRFCGKSWTHDNLSSALQGHLVFSLYTPEIYEQSCQMLLLKPTLWFPISLASLACAVSYHFKFNRCLVHWQISFLFQFHSIILYNMIEKWLHFKKLMVCRIFTRHLICISFLVQIFRQFIRAISWNYVLNCWNAEQWIFAPVKASCTQLFDAKEQVKPVIIRGLNQLLITKHW